MTTDYKGLKVIIAEGESIWLHLDDELFVRKMQTARNYPEMAFEVSRAVESHGAEAFRFGIASGLVEDIASWWWEARLHPQWGTIEVRPIWERPG